MDEKTEDFTLTEDAIHMAWYQRGGKIAYTNNKFIDFRSHKMYLGEEVVTRYRPPIAASQRNVYGVWVTPVRVSRFNGPIN